MTGVRRIGVFGGSFDPPHCGHVLLGAYALSTASIDELWVVPTYAHPLGKNVSSFEHRIAMCELAFAPLAKTYVSAIESGLPSPSFTVHTLRAIKAQVADAELHLIVGSDVARHFSSWHLASEVALLARPWVAVRAGHEDDEERGLLPEVSSTDLRSTLATSRGEHEELGAQLPRAVLEYIRLHRLYA